MDLNYFLEHFNREALSESEVGIAVRLLTELYHETGGLWKPFQCRDLRLGTEDAERVRQQNGASRFFGEIKDMRYLHCHFYWASETPKGTFILDPTGVAHEHPDISIGLRPNIPYFGIRSSATGNHKKIYDRMQDDDRK